MFNDWGYDGLKLDGQHMNAVPPCYNPAHKHARPEESVEALPAFFKMIYDTARSIKPDALVEFCPCGTAFNFFTLPNLNMTVASDPHNSWQVRTKGKTLKALHGDAHRLLRRPRGIERWARRLRVHTRHRRRGRDAVHLAAGFGGAQPAGSHAGKGGIWQNGSGSTTRRCCRAANISAACTTSASTGRKHTPSASRARCSMRFSLPSGMARSKLRGLGTGNYRIVDYENDKVLGTVHGPSGVIEAQFDKHLLIRADPE